MAPRKKATKTTSKPKRSSRKLPDLDVRNAKDVAGGSDWEVARTYKVWDASRKVFVYPENWLKP
jgi:hypothetical protein